MPPNRVATGGSDGAQRAASHAGAAARGIGVPLATGRFYTRQDMCSYGAATRGCRHADDSPTREGSAKGSECAVATVTRRAL